jgi:hypothetical protein
MAGAAAVAGSAAATGGAGNGGQQQQQQQQAGTGVGAPATGSEASPNGAASTNETRSTLNYFLTLLRGSLVVVQLDDRSCFEGLLHTVEFGAAPGNGTLVLQMVQRQPDSFAADACAPRPYETSASLPRNTAPFEGVLKLPLARVVHVAASDINIKQWTVEYAEQQAKLQKAKQAGAKGGPPGSSVSGGVRGFATDSAISGRDNDNQRELVRWDGGGAGAGGGAADGLGDLETFGRGGGAQGFNQFETFERMTGKQSTFRFDDVRGDAQHRSRMTEAECNQHFVLILPLLCAVSNDRMCSSARFVCSCAVFAVCSIPLRWTRVLPSTRRTKLTPRHLRARF